MFLSDTGRKLGFERGWAFQQPEIARSQKIYAGPSHEERNIPVFFFSRFAILNHTHLPNKEAFRNDLDGTPISSSDYEHAQTVWDVFKCETFKDYLHVYLLCDVLHLADVFEAFRDKCLADYRLDPAHYFSSPHFTYDASC